MIKLMERNYFATMDYRTWLVIAAGIVPALAMVSCIAGPFTRT